METVTGVEPALMELQSIAFPLGYTVIVVYMLQIRYGLMRVKNCESEKLNRETARTRSALVPAERIELTSSASEADVLPLDEAELSHPARHGRECLISYNYLVNRHIKYMCQYDYVVDRGHSVSSHPLEYRLRRVEAEYCLYISYLESFAFYQSSDVCACCYHIDSRSCYRHKNNHLSE